MQYYHNYNHTCNIKYSYVVKNNFQEVHHISLSLYLSTCPSCIARMCYIDGWSSLPGAEASSKLGTVHIVLRSTLYPIHQNPVFYIIFHTSDPPPPSPSGCWWGGLATPNPMLPQIMGRNKSGHKVDSALWEMYSLS